MGKRCVSEFNTSMFVPSFFHVHAACYTKEDLFACFLDAITAVCDEGLNEILRFAKFYWVLCIKYRVSWVHHIFEIGYSFSQWLLASSVNSVVTFEQVPGYLKHQDSEVTLEGECRHKLELKVRQSRVCAVSVTSSCPPQNINTIDPIFCDDRLD